MTATWKLMPNIGCHKRSSMLSVVRSQLLYAACMWYLVVKHKLVKKQERIQRLMCINIYEKGWRHSRAFSHISSYRRKKEAIMRVYLKKLLEQNAWTNGRKWEYLTKVRWTCRHRDLDHTGRWTTITHSRSTAVSGSNTQNAEIILLQIHLLSGLYMCKVAERKAGLQKSRFLT